MEIQLKTVEDEIKEKKKESERVRQVVINSHNSQFRTEFRAKLKSWRNTPKTKSPDNRIEENTKQARREALSPIEKRLSETKKKVGDVNLMEAMEKSIDFLLDPSQLPEEPKLQGLDVPMWNSENQRVKAETLPEPLTSDMKFRIRKILQEELTDTVALNSFEDFQTLMLRLKCRTELEVTLAVHRAAEEFDELLCDNIEWQNVPWAEGETLTRKFKRNTLKFYMKQRAGEFQRAIPLQIECVKELISKEEITDEDFIKEIFMRTMEESIARLWWVYNMEVPVGKGAEFRRGS